MTNVSRNQDQAIYKTNSNPTMLLVGGSDSGRRSEHEATHIDVLRDDFRKTLFKANFKDKITNLYNEVYFERVFKDVWLKQQVYKDCLSLVLCNIDYLKRYNDTYGYQKGNQVLKQVVNKIQQQLEDIPDSIVSRYESDYFAILLPSSLIDDAMLHTEAMLQNIKELAIPHVASEVDNVVTASFGIARNAAYTLPPAWSQNFSFYG